MIWTILIGLVAGLLARAIKPGNDAMGWIMTIVLGIAGALEIFFKVYSYSTRVFGIFQYPAYIKSEMGDMFDMWIMIRLSVIAIVLAFTIQMFVLVPYLYG